MSVADKLSRLSTARDNIITALAEKSVTATGHGFEDFPADIRSISGGGGSHSPSISVADTGVVTASCGGTSVTHTLSSSDDADFIASNIKDGVEIFGVEGTFEGGDLEVKAVTPSASAQEITPSSGYYGLSSVTVNGDSDLISSNIKENIEIFGVTGTYTGESGSGGLNYTETSNSTGTTFAITRTAGGYGYSYVESAQGDGTKIDISCTGSEIGQSACSIIVATLSTNINRVVAAYGSSYVSGYVSNNVGYINIPYSYTGSVTVKGYIDSTMMTSTTVTITGIDKYTCTLEV